MKFPLPHVISAAGLCALAALAALVLAGPAHAQGYPDKPVRLIVGFAPGGTNDVLARLMATKLQERFKQNFVVENKPGAASMIAAELAARAPADGYTLFVASSGVLTVNPALYTKINYDPVKDFEPVALLGSFPLVVTTSPGSQIKDVKGLIEAARRAPGQTLDHGVGSSPFQLAAELFARDVGIRFSHIPYKGTGPTVTALLGNEVPLAVLDVAGVIPNIKAGRLGAVAVTTARRSSVLPDVPTLAESGVKDYDVAIWTGLVTPAGTPPDVTARLRAALADILADKDVQSRLAALGMDAGHTDVPVFSRLIASDLARWVAVARAANIKAE
ncbi:Bug family tripartite tricarboxylate transporter substrate binding protein [Pseudorhodoferax sp.]|uniref:Bug family tripartite tricarboxylate transporter substrate binding protein n=1 Tax=Pseudorhodoferax sp. TaxID=1993553 RepID=UPI002DD6B8FB|nr:tripartite tricarboxylate transporter substrate-binding protein [Pseudorhodoferax sp.]